MIEVSNGKFLQRVVACYANDFISTRSLVD